MLPCRGDHKTLYPGKYFFITYLGIVTFINEAVAFSYPGNARLPITYINKVEQFRAFHTVAYQRL